jgi:hypothetical protein
MTRVVSCRYAADAAADEGDPVFAILAGSFDMQMLPLGGLLHRRVRRDLQLILLALEVFNSPNTTSIFVGAIYWQNLEFRCGRPFLRLHTHR